MSRDSLAEIPDRLEALGTLLSEGLLNRYGNDAARCLVEVGAVPADLLVYLAKFNAPADVALDQFLTRSLYNDGLTLVALACLRGGAEVHWETLDEMLPLLKRFASFYSTLSTRYAGFRTLSRDRLSDFWNSYCGDGDWFGLVAEPTRFQAVRLCAFHDARSQSDEAVPGLLNGILGPLWQRASQCAGIRTDDATLIWADLEDLARRCHARWQN